MQLGSQFDFTAGCEALRLGRSYVSDGFAHALDFRVGDVAPGFGDVALAAPGKVRVTAKVALPRSSRMLSRTDNNQRAQRDSPATP